MQSKQCVLNISLNISIFTTQIQIHAVTGFYDPRKVFRADEIGQENVVQGLARLM